jgi:hypothetical protein
MTQDVSHLYRQQAGPVFGVGNRTGRDVLALSSGRVDAAKMELHEAAEREMVAAGDGDHSGALDRVIAGARTGIVTLSQAARTARITAPRTHRGRNGVVHDAATGRMLTLAGGPASERLGGPPVLADDRDRHRWRDTLAACNVRSAGTQRPAHLRPGAADGRPHLPGDRAAAAAVGAGDGGVARLKRKQVLIQMDVELLARLDAYAAEWTNGNRSRASVGLRRRRSCGVRSAPRSSWRTCGRRW